MVGKASIYFLRLNNSRFEVSELLVGELGKFGPVSPLGPFKYYVIKEVGGWSQKIAIFDDLQYCKSSKRWVGLKKSKT